jgi:hypothetical protein
MVYTISGVSFEEARLVGTPLEESLSCNVSCVSESRCHNSEFNRLALGLWNRGVRAILEEVVDCLKVEGVGLK